MTRPHDGTAKERREALIALIAAARQYVALHAFPDMDPALLRISLEMRGSSISVPVHPGWEPARTE